MRQNNAAIGATIELQSTSEAAGSIPADKVVFTVHVFYNENASAVTRSAQQLGFSDLLFVFFIAYVVLERAVVSPLRSSLAADLGPKATGKARWRWRWPAERYHGEIGNATRNAVVRGLTSAPTRSARR